MRKPKKAVARAKIRRAKPGAKGGGRFFHIQLRPSRDFVAFRVQDVGGPGGVERVAGLRANGSWDTAKWLVEKTHAHVEGNRLVADTAEARKVLATARLRAGACFGRSLSRQAEARHSGTRKADAGDAAGATRQHQEGAGGGAQTARNQSSCQGLTARKSGVHR